MGVASQKRAQWLSTKADESDVTDLMIVLKAACRCISVKSIEVRDVTMLKFEATEKLQFRRLKSLVIANSAVTIDAIVDMCHGLTIDYFEMVDVPLCMFNCSFEKLFGEVSDFIANHVNFRHEHSPADETLMLLKDLSAEMLSGLISYDKLGRAKELYVSCVAQFVAVLTRVRRRSVRSVLKAMNCINKNTKRVTQSDRLDMNIANDASEAELASILAAKLGNLYANVSPCMPLSCDYTKPRHWRSAMQYSLSGSGADADVKRIFSVEIIAMKKDERVKDQVEYLVSEVGTYPITRERYVKTRVFVYTNGLKGLPTIEQVIGEEEATLVMMGCSDVELSLVNVHRILNRNDDSVGNLERDMASYDSFLTDPLAVRSFVRTSPRIKSNSLNHLLSVYLGEDRDAGLTMPIVDLSIKMVMSDELEFLFGNLMFALRSHAVKRARLCNDFVSVDSYDSDNASDIADDSETDELSDNEEEKERKRRGGTSEKAESLESHNDKSSSSPPPQTELALLEEDKVSSHMEQYEQHAQGQDAHWQDTQSQEDQMQLVRVRVVTEEERSSSTGTTENEEIMSDTISSSSSCSSGSGSGGVIVQEDESPQEHYRRRRSQKLRNEQRVQFTEEDYLPDTTEDLHLDDFVDEDTIFEIVNMSIQDLTAIALREFTNEEFAVCEVDAENRIRESGEKNMPRVTVAVRTSNRRRRKPNSKCASEYGAVRTSNRRRRKPNSKCASEYGAVRTSNRRRRKPNSKCASEYGAVRTSKRRRKPNSKYASEYDTQTQRKSKKPLDLRKMSLEEFQEFFRCDSTLEDSSDAECTTTSRNHCYSRSNIASQTIRAVASCNKEMDIPQQLHANCV
ncbi:hypothetical protein V5799_021533 [Amblyomma americanum]|uniref:Uncharacterized protein n=1 Tax=Amblyomma americanum TaxID=6943 RepID=A0AAQ4FN37_AMBAM